MTSPDSAYQAALEAAAAKIMAQNGASSTPSNVAAAALVAADDGIRRFSSRRKNVKFYIDDDLFEAVGAAPADFMEELGIKLESLTSDGGMKQYEEIKDTISKLLVPASRELFTQRRASFEDPITLNVVAEVGALLLSEVSGRPTSPQSPSASAPAETSTISMAGPSPKV